MTLISLLTAGITGYLCQSSVDMQSQTQVVSSSSLPFEISTRDIPLDTIIKACDNKDHHIGEMPAICATQLDGYLSFSYSTGRSLENVDFSQVVKYLKVADDCHSYNVLLKRGSTIDSIKLSTTRAIAEGKALSLWFASEILAAIHIPFLTPANIKGEKNYTCHKCNRTYEYPNPLKMHLSLNDCDKKVSLKNILRRLCMNIKSVTSDRRKQTNFEGGILHSVPTIKTEVESDSSISSLPEQLSRLNATTTFHSCSKVLHDVHLPLTDTKVVLSRRHPVESNKKVVTRETPQYCSAFKPYRNGACQNITEDVSDSYRTLLSPSLVSLPDTTGTGRFSRSHNDTRSLFVLPGSSPKNNDVLRKSFHDELDLLEKRAVDMETFVSNLGKLKHGHLCLYCGKVYSRKYGLKIHIRTHTGFKPLKCKYCLRPFGDPSNLNKHIRLHAEGETPYRCELCNKILVRRRDLERHMKSRHQTSCSVTVSETVSDS